MKKVHKNVTHLGPVMSLPHEFFLLYVFMKHMAVYTAYHECPPMSLIGGEVLDSFYFASTSVNCVLTINT